MKMKSTKMKKIVVSSVAIAVLMLGCEESVKTVVETKEVEKSLSAPQLGELLYKDRTLSLHQNMACATCHDLEHGFVDARFDSAHGGIGNRVDGALSEGSDNFALGGRNAPSAGYAKFSPEFHFNTNESRHVGGQFWDGRAKDLQAQAKGPFLDTAEMMMPSAEAVVDRVMENDLYVESFKTLYGSDIFEDKDEAYEKVAQSVADYESSEVFTTYSSRYDKYKDGNDSALSNLEKEGMLLFFANDNVSCKNCHQLDESPTAKHELFTNQMYSNIGTPQNISALKVKFGDAMNPADHIDHGLFGRSDIADFNITAAQDGFVKTPTLRNVAVTGPYMSNGVFSDLQTVLEFYDHMSGSNGDHPLNRETGEAWNAPDVNTTIDTEDLKIADGMNDAKIHAIEAFLRTLTDEKFEYLMPSFRAAP